MLINGAEVGIRDRNGNTLAHMVVYEAKAHPNCAGMLRLLLEKGANLNVKNVKGETPADIATRKGYPNEILQLLKSTRTS